MSSTDRRCSEAHTNRGIELANAGKHAAAVAEFNAAIDHGQSDVAYGARAASKQHLGDIAGAFEDCEAALAINPQQSGALVTRGSIAAAKRDHAAAIADYTAAIAIEPECFPALVNRALEYRRMGRTADAEADIAAVLRYHPDRRPQVERVLSQVPIVSARD